jgi:hypothetical protein
LKALREALAPQYDQASGDFKRDDQSNILKKDAQLRAQTTGGRQQKQQTN